MLRSLKWISAIGIGLTIAGGVTIAMAIRAYPQSDLLGGWGLILGPIYWLGLLLCFFAVVGWIIVGLRAATRIINGTRKKDRGNGNGEDRA